MRWQLSLLIAVVLTALAVVSSQHQARQAFMSLQRAQAQQRQLEEEWGRLQLEQSTWATHARVGQIATTQLQMQLPDTRQLRVVTALPQATIHP